MLHDGEVEVTVRDRGRWREHRPPSDQGRGLDLIDALMDDVRVETTTDGHDRAPAPAADASA